MCVETNQPRYRLQDGLWPNHDKWEGFLNRKHYIPFSYHLRIVRSLAIKIKHFQHFQKLVESWGAIMGLNDPWSDRIIICFTSKTWKHCLALKHTIYGLSGPGRGKVGQISLFDWKLEAATDIEKQKFMHFHPRLRLKPETQIFDTLTAKIR